MPGVKSIDKFHDFLAEVDGYQLDLLLVAETLRGEHEKTFFTADGHRFFLSGGSAGRHGVAIVAGRSLYAYGVCQTRSFMHIPTGCVHYPSVWKVFLSIFFCYMPTSWDPYHEAEEIYDFRLAASAMVAGDFNAKLADP